MSEFDLAQRIADLERQLNNLAIDGVIADVQHNPYRVRVNYGSSDEPVLTDWLPVAVTRAANAITWWPLEVGEAVMVLSPNGDTTRGRVYPAEYTENNTQPDTNPDHMRINFGNGNSVVIDRATGKMNLIITNEVTINVGATTLTLKPDGTVLTTPSYDLNKS